MYKLLQLSTYGMKNIEREITINFSNETIKNGITKINNVKGIFGYNGAGKSAIIMSVDLYKNIVCDPTFLVQKKTIEQLNKLLNYKRNEFYISMSFEYIKNHVLKHYIKITKNPVSSNYIISEERIMLSNGRTINEEYLSLISKSNGILSFSDNNEIDYLSLNDLEFTSMITLAAKKILSKNGNIDQFKNSLEIEKIILYLYVSVFNIDVFLLQEDKHTVISYEDKIIMELISKINNYNTTTENNITFFSNDSIIPISEYEAYEKETKKLESFIQLFKPELKKIELIKLIDRDYYHIRKIFVYEDYKVELEFESSGIKQLVKLFTYLSRCAKGYTTFIDEIDTNINSVYFEKLISFFQQYGKGQLIFTTHNIESMNVLKNQSRSIVVLGVDNNLDTWTPKGNRSPINSYYSGGFLHSPMNVEDFDFINIFLGE